MSGRLLRFIGDRAVEPSETERDRVRRRRGVIPSAAHAVPEAEPEPTPPARMTAHGPGGRAITVHAADVVKRLPALEAIADEITGERPYVWQIVHTMDADAGQLRGMVGREGGQVHLFLNVMALPCPLLRLATLRHELEHVLRHDLDSPLGWDAHMEDRCWEAAETSMACAASIYGRRRAPNIPALNAGACVKCYRSGGSCRQDPATFADLKARSPY